jgi:hypothetical protein
MLRKVRITSVPKARTGYQVNGGLANDVPAMGGGDYNSGIGQPNQRVSKTLTAVPRKEANLEAEGGETVIGNLDGSGMPSFKTIEGPRHSSGGVPLSLPDDSFIFSDTKAMKITDPEILKMFGVKSKKGGYTPAELSKKFDLQEYRSVLQNPDSDKIDVKTAELMIKTYTLKLGALALAQESKKGFPQGIPEIARPYMEANGITEEDLIPELAKQQNPQEQMMEQGYEPNYQEDMMEAPMEMPNGQPIAMPQDMEQMSPEMMQEAPMAMYGAEMGGFYPEYAFGGELYKAQEGLITPYAGGSKATPTGRENKFSRKEGIDKYLATWESIIPGISRKSEGEAQKLIYQWSLKNNPEALKSMWLEYGLTEKGKKDPNLLKLTQDGVFTEDALKDPEVLKKLEEAYADNYFGGRQVDPKEDPVETPVEVVEQDEYTCECVLSDGSKYNPGQDADGNCFECEEAIADSQNINFNKQDRVSPAWWAQDQIALAGALGDLWSTKKYQEHEPGLNLIKREGIYKDPTRELGKFSELSNQNYAALSQSVNPQTASAIRSGIYGKEATAIADALARYNNDNVNIANQLDAYNTDIENKERMLNRDINVSRFDKNTIGKQQYDNSIKAGRANARQALSTGITNKWKTDALNQMYPNYQVDPRSGGKVFYNPTEKIVKAENEQSALDFAKSLREEHLDPEMQLFLLKQKYGTKKAGGQVFEHGGFVYSVFPTSSL